MRKYFITVLFSLLLAVSVVLFILPGDTASVLSENREPQAMPAFSAKSALNGTFEAQFDQYVNDNTAFRSKLMKISDKLRSHTGFIPDGVGRIISTTADIGTGESREERLVVYNGSIMEMFEAHPETEEKYATALKTIRAALPPDTDMYSVIIPTLLEFTPSDLSAAQDSQQKAISSVYGMLGDGIKPVDVYSKLGKAAETEGYLYFRTDHHWTQDGSYCGYDAFMRAQGMEPAAKDSYERKSNGSFFGSLYLKAKSQLGGGQPDDECFFYDSSANGNIDITMRAEDGAEYGAHSPVFHLDHSDYGVFFGGDNPLMDIKNNAKPDGETLLIIKDSYANAMIPWLINDYGRVIVVDPRSFHPTEFGSSFNKLIKEYGITKVAVINYVFSTTFSDYCDILTNFTK